VVDDHPELCDLLGTFLAEAGFDACCVTSGAAAARLLAEERFDGAILDLLLPDGPQGVALARMAAARGVAVILISGAVEAEAITYGLPYPLLAKPFRLDQLRALLRTVLP
jgi:DNA-binding response OmpR family regulator